MWSVVKLGICVVVVCNVSAVPTVVAAVARTVVRRSSACSVASTFFKAFQADVVIAFEESFGYEPFKPQKISTSSDREFETIKAQRRFELGLSPEASKR